MWPDLSFTSDWNTVLIQAKCLAPTAAEPIRYLNEYNNFIPVGNFENAIEGLIESTIERLSIAAKGYTDLAELWEEVTQERNDPEVAEWRKMEACMGFDPDESPEDLLGKLLNENSNYGAKAVQEMAAASKTQAITHLEALTEDIRCRHTQPVIVSSCNEIRSILSAQPQRLNEPPWQRAARAARIARDVWALDDGPISTNVLSELFEINAVELGVGEIDNSRRLPLSAGMRSEDLVEGFRVSLHQRHPSGRRFTLARLVGDHLDVGEDEPLMPATRAKTIRQKFQRAFAQELLCPLEDLKSYLDTAFPTDDDINDAADHFNVSPLTIQTTLVNKGLLERETLVGDWNV